MYGCNLSPAANQITIIIAAAGAVPPLIALFWNPSVEVKTSAAWALVLLAPQGTLLEFACGGMPIEA